MTGVDQLLSDLTSVRDGLVEVLRGLEGGEWSTPTPAVSWDVRDQLAHLVLVEEYAVLATTDAAAFAEVVAESVTDGPGFEAALQVRGRTVAGEQLLLRWQVARKGLDAACAAVTAPARIAWFGPSMSVRSFLTARMMETWAHGQDVRDALGLPPDESDAVRHVAHLGVITRAWSHRVHGQEPPAGEVAVRLRAPSGDVWCWGGDEDDELVSGTALDFCLVVTQRRHWRDTGLRVTGAAARSWMEVAQAFAGPPTTTVPGRGIKKEISR